MPETYSNDNLRFRRAVIRERLSELKIERDRLAFEKEEIDRRINEAGVARASEQAARSRRLRPVLRQA